ncbi:MAG: Clp protease [Geodermatophilaceae bacterium]|nr:Clp protease [Geodermatophilaceae bacterium]
MFERFSRSAREAVVRAQEEMRRLDADRLGTEHLLLGMFADTDSSAGAALKRLGLTPAATRRRIGELAGPDAALDAEALRSLGIDLDAVRRQAEAAFGPGALNRTCRGSRHRGFLPFSPRAKKVLELALRESVRRGDGHIGTEHIVLGILSEARGLAAVILAEVKVDRAAFEAALIEREPGQADAG